MCDLGYDSRVTEHRRPERGAEVESGDAADPESSGPRSAPAPQPGPAGVPRSTYDATLSRHERLLLGGRPSLTLAQLAESAGTSVDVARHFWRAMGFADVRPDDVRFTERDVEALRGVADLIDDKDDGLPSPSAPGGGLAASSVFEMLRAQSYTMDRLVLWQLETFVADVVQRLHLDDTAARLVVLDHVDEMTASLRSQLDYVWSRHMAALLGRTDAEVSGRGREEAGPDLYPLTRSLGFVDIVAFTQRAQTMGRTQLETMLNDFETTARDVVTSRGARVVKTIGDAVMYIADDVVTAADVVTALVRELQSGPVPMHVRASLVQGRVVSRSGDVFGPTVNLASRLVDTAEPGGIRMDEPTARALMNGPEAARYRVSECKEVVAKGLGNIVPWSLAKA